jgi:hypothetical protein
MPTPLSEAFVFCLKSDATAALAALTVIAGSHRGLLDWFSRTVCGDAPELQSGRQKPNGAARRGREANGHRKPRVNGGDPYLDRRMLVWRNRLRASGSWSGRKRRAKRRRNGLSRCRRPLAGNAGRTRAPEATVKTIRLLSAPYGITSLH